MIPRLTENTPFPPVTQALRDPDGLLAAGGILSPERLLEAYRCGIFPWFNAGEAVLWWSPDPRMVLIPEEFRLSDSLARVLRNTCYEVRTDTSFEQVMRACAAPRDGKPGTWIDERMIAAYCTLHSQGYAHSVETWMDGKLVGGLYGVAIGQMFYGESMFSLVSNASKIALAHLCRQLQRWQSAPATCLETGPSTGLRTGPSTELRTGPSTGLRTGPSTGLRTGPSTGLRTGPSTGLRTGPSTELRTCLIDCQMYTPHLASLGARLIPRGEFMGRLEKLVNCAPVTHWRFDPGPYFRNAGKC